MSQDARKEELKALFCGKLVQVTLSDSRVLRGKLECFDNGQNVILGDSTQINDGANTSLGFVMLPGSHIKRIDLEES